MRNRYNKKEIIYDIRLTRGVTNSYVIVNDKNINYDIELAKGVRNSKIAI